MKELNIIYLYEALNQTRVVKWNLKLNREEVTKQTKATTGNVEETVEEKK